MSNRLVPVDGGYSTACSGQAAQKLGRAVAYEEAHQDIVIHEIGHPMLHGSFAHDP